jgi:hypothetical protein
MNFRGELIIENIINKRRKLMMHKRKKSEEDQIFFLKQVKNLENFTHINDYILKKVKNFTFYVNKELT